MDDILNIDYASDVIIVHEHLKYLHLYARE